MLFNKKKVTHGRDSRPLTFTYGRGRIIQKTVWRGRAISQILVIKLQNQTNCHTDVIYTAGFASKNINNAEFYFFLVCGDDLPSELFAPSINNSKFRFSQNLPFFFF